MKVDISPYYMNFIENLPTHRVTRLVFFLFYIFLESFISPENWIEFFFLFWVNIEKKFPHLFKQTFLKKLMFFFLIFNSIFFSSQKKKLVVRAIYMEIYVFQGLETLQVVTLLVCGHVR